MAGVCVSSYEGRFGGAASRCGGEDLVLPSFDANAFPEGDAALDFGSGRTGFGVVPRSVFVFHAIDFHVIVVGRAFPRADGCVRAGFQDIFGDGVCREILIPFDDDRVVTFGDDFATPDGFCHELAPLAGRENSAMEVSLPDDWMRRD